MRIHILGICGKFMAGIAVLAKQSGFEVSGSDLNVYPPMSTQLEEQGIQLCQGFDPKHLDPETDLVIVGNVISRGNPMLEYVLDHHIPYQSAPEWLAQNILKDRWVLAVAGTHGKTTTTSLLAWILEFAGLDPGFLVGGVPENFGISARLGKHPFFVIEADEYDSAFSDKRSKFIHYHPKTLILNNLEFDHADIFPDLKAIMQQFHHLIRTVPGNGLIVHHAKDKNLGTVLSMGVWTPLMSFGSDQGAWQAKCLHPSGSVFDVFFEGKKRGRVEWELIGQHNVENALAAIAVAYHAGVLPAVAIEALALFKNVKCRMEVKGVHQGITIYDDFAHHPTAIQTTLAGLRAKVGKARIIAVLELGSYTMRTGVHKDQIPGSLQEADLVICKNPPGQDWGLHEVMQGLKQPHAIYQSVDEILEHLSPQLQSGDHVIFMSNAGFNGIHEKLLKNMKAMAG